jgi:hypothetical protein
MLAAVAAACAMASGAALAAPVEGPAAQNAEKAEKAESAGQAQKAEKPEKPQKAPKALMAQVQRLAELLRDAHATYYADFTLAQRVRPRGGDELALVVFSIEGFGGGNGHTQYLAAFTPNRREQGEEHFTLIDVIPIGGKGWRAIPALEAKVTRAARGGETRIVFGALAVGEGDAPNFPSRPATVTVVLKNGRLAEQAPR